ncbi:vWA domain-containing protein [Virgibacillus salinus]|uniref:Ca-activated chloride channel family protein n=1 Tax=Virgibacillus salinus TaxID=553311 RepID=A0A1H0ZLX3_9BACI|nr:VWA domain-containing protein [Virgibacillus salinus]SDQ28460.1 Ca-activated chloride channel family protein [Virgibacillus salinus]
MLKKFCYVFSIIAVLIVISGCNENEEENQALNEEEKATEQEESITSDKENTGDNNDLTSQDDAKTDNNDILEQVKPIPTNISGFISQQPGMFANKSVYDNEKEVKKQLKKLPPMSENASEKELKKYLAYMYWLVAEDLPNPKDMIKKWEFSSFGNPDLPDSRYHFKENYNIEVILDSSGSMAAVTTVGKTRMELAKETINNFLKNIPEKANVSLRVYGHKGSGSDADKDMSCSAIEQVYGFAPYNANKIQQALNKFSPKGWTPIAAALKQSKEALKQFEAKNNSNLIYLVSDGVSTCDGDPVKVAKSLSNSNAKPVINIIGYQADGKAQEQLQKMAEASNGVYTTANDQNELEEEFDRAEEVLELWKEWKEDALQDLDAMSVNNGFDIMELSNNWHFRSLSQGNHLLATINLAEEAGIVTFEQEQKLQKRAHKVNDMVKQLDGEIEENLKNISTENIKKTKKSINEKFNKQTQN